jgi:hypothetical protein
MREKLNDLWLTFLLKFRIKKMDFCLEVVSTEGREGFECCEPMALCITAEYKWFWEKSTPIECCENG